jgi:hypothetical protein
MSKARQAWRFDNVEFDFAMMRKSIDACKRCACVDRLPNMDGDVIIVQ